MTITNGTASSDTLFIGSGRSGDTLLGLAGGDILSGLTGAGGNTLDGGDGDDTIYANQNDTVIGGAGDDLIYGGLGGNNITGGLGRDLFVLTGINLPTTPNTIADYNLLDDTIEVDLATGSNIGNLTTALSGTDTTISFGGTQLALVKNAKLSANDLIVVMGPDAPMPTTPTPTPPPTTPITGVTLNQNLFTTDSTFKSLGINALSQKPSNKVNEIGIFAVDDATGKIGGIAPGATGYLKAVTDSARSIFSTLGGNFFTTSKRELALAPNKTYELFEVQDGSIADLQQQIAGGKTPTNILFSVPDASGNSPLKVIAKSTKDGYLVSVNNDELVLNVANTDGAIPNTPAGAKSQSLAQGRTLDLTDFAGMTLKADLTTTSAAAYNDNIGFYAVEDAIGTIKLADGSTLKPGDANYAVKAIQSAILQVGKTDNKTNQDLVGGKIYAPVVVAQGSLTDFASKNINNSSTDANAIHAYFNYLGANPDKLDHFRLLGNNTFGVEDLYGGGDRDFNDLVVNVNVKTA